jgi:SAM-dependent methyltransferase
VLDLGCGIGRIAEPLTALGHRVVGVDESADMLAHLRRAEPVLSRIDSLDLDERFGGVLLASTLVNTYDPVQRTGLLAAARRTRLRNDLLVAVR